MKVSIKAVPATTGIKNEVNSIDEGIWIVNRHADMVRRELTKSRRFERIQRIAMIGTGLIVVCAFVAWVIL